MVLFSSESWWLCSSCQPFSTYANKKNKNKDPNKYDLLNEFGRLVKAVRPDMFSKMSRKCTSYIGLQVEECIE